MPILTWYTPEFDYYQRGIIWKIIASLIVFGSSFLAFWSGAWSFGVLILVFAFVYYLIYFKSPNLLKAEVNDKGILYGKNFYRFENIKNFWVIYNPPFTRALYLKLSDRMLDEIKIIIPKESPEKLREILKIKIKELSGKSETIQEVFSKILKIS